MKEGAFCSPELSGNPALFTPNFHAASCGTMWIFHCTVSPGLALTRVYTVRVVFYITCVPPQCRQYCHGMTAQNFYPRESQHRNGQMKNICRPKESMYMRGCLKIGCRKTHMGLIFRSGYSSAALIFSVIRKVPLQGSEYRL